MSSDAPQPRAVLGMPAYNKAQYLPEALESLLAQTCPEFVIVVTDDSTSDESSEVVARYAATDSRIVYQRNEERLGLVGNWRRSFDIARRVFPEAPFFAWVSDHDVWHPDWLAALLSELDSDSDAVLAYPLSTRVDEQGVPLNESLPFSTTGICSPRQRLADASFRMPAGDMVYGLFRSVALERTGGMRYVLGPDRLLLSQLAVMGEFRQVTRRLWYRRFVGLTTRDRQRAAFFTDREPPHYSHLPVGLVHAGGLAWALTRAPAAHGVSRGQAIGLGLYYTWLRANIGARRAIAKRFKRLQARVPKPLRQLVRGTKILRAP